MSMIMSPSGSPNSSCSEASAFSAIATASVRPVFEAAPALSHTSGLEPAAFPLIWYESRCLVAADSSALRSDQEDAALPFTVQLENATAGDSGGQVQRKRFCPCPIVRTAVRARMRG